MGSVLEFCSALEGYGFNFSAGVPCAVLKDIIAYFQQASEVPYVGAAREDEAIGAAAGAYLAGKNPVVMMQSSGVGNSLHTLSTLNLRSQIPTLFLISWPGYPGEAAAKKLPAAQSPSRLLEEFDIPSLFLGKDKQKETLAQAVELMRQKNTPVAIIVTRGVFSE